MDNENSRPLVLSCSPHFHSANRTDKAMRDVIFAALPAALCGVYFFGLKALLVIIGCILGTVAGEFAANKLRGREQTLGDCSAVVTGLLLAMCLPAGLPVWMAFLGGIFAIVIGKQVYGGLGQNAFNPALIGRALLLASFPVQMAEWAAPRGLDAMTTATPMAILKEGAMSSMPSLTNMVIGRIGGSLGETCSIALILGGLYLIYRKHVDWKIPTLYIGTVFVLSLIFGAVKGYGVMYAVYGLFGGGLLLGAFFMATDWVTSPITLKGRIIYGIGLGVLTSLIRFFGGLNEGVCYSILLMNILTPLIDRYTRGRIYGRVDK